MNVYKWWFLDLFELKKVKLNFFWKFRVWEVKVEVIRWLQNSRKEVVVLWLVMLVKRSCWLLGYSSDVLFVFMVPGLLKSI